VAKSKGNGNGNRRIGDVMTPDPIVVERGTRVDEVARLMRDRDIGDVLVTDDGGRLCGIATDRDLVVRYLAEPRSEMSSINEFCSNELVTVEPSTTETEAAQLMRDRALRRLPVVENGTPVGIVTIGDLAVDMAPKSVLAGISQAPPNS
jgi:CBS domain-containing protein